ncbi:MAG: C25 family cysteine peptidase [Bacteroidales bacterium]|nr:C25 family cysteine peptidase [Bacteroidales bacterium]
MLKSLLRKSLVIMLIAVATSAFAQDLLLTVGKTGDVKNETTLAFQNDHQTSIRFELNVAELIAVNTGDGKAFIATSDNAPLMLQEGSPEVFYLTASFIMPDRGSSELEITYGAFQEFDNIEIAPSKGNLKRSVDPSTVPFVKGEVYQHDGFYPGTLASLREPFIMRDVRGQSLDVYPVQYNPVTKVLRVYSEITVTVNYTDTEGINEFTNQKRHTTIEPQFNEIYNNLFINHSVIQGRGFPTGEEGELLIICHPQFMNDMQPYVDWKRTIGRKTTMIPTTEAGSTYSAIKTYIQNYYNNPNNNLAYVLLVGDLAQIPTYTYTVPGYPSETCYSDIYYAQLASAPYLDILIGRMSAETAAHVQTQVQRSIWYERDLTTTDTWLSKAVGLAANEGNGGGHSGEADYVHMNNIRNRLMTYGYNPVYQEYSNNCPGITNTTTAQISSRFNEGMGMANYCNHGDYDGWYLTQGYSYISYTNSNVNTLQNAGKLPYVFSVACLNGKFSTTCFAEVWMRATQGGQPTGAVATMMGSISLSWQPPMTAQDEFVNICLDLPPYAGAPAGIKRTFAGASLNASQKMRIIHGTSANHDFNAWLVFGDPTLMFRTKTPQAMTITHVPTLPAGSTSLTVNCNTADALAALTYVDNGEVVILGTATVTGNKADITFAPLTTTANLTLAVTGFNKVTYQSVISVGGTLELPPPQNLTYTVEKANHVILSWDAPVDKGMTVTGYNIYRDDELINTEPTRSFADIVPQNDTYKYAVTALYDTAGTLESDPCEPVTVVIDGMCISIADDIVAEQETDGYNVLISWNAPEYEGVELAGYNIIRDTEQLNDELLPAATLNFLDEGLEPETTYCYQVEVVYNDCEDPLTTDEQCVTIEPVVSVNEPFGDKTFQIFPNPAHGELNIAGNVVPTAVRIYNITGQLVYETTQCTAEMKITVASMPTGVYFIKIDSERGVVTRKVVFD